MGKFIPTVCIDFDGVIHSYTSKFTVPEEIPDDIVPGIAGVIEELQKTCKVVVFTTRASTEAGLIAVKKWLTARGIFPNDVTDKKPPSIVYIDDRAICFDGDTTSLVEKVLNFKPWNRK